MEVLVLNNMEMRREERELDREERRRMATLEKEDREQRDKMEREERERRDQREERRLASEKEEKEMKDLIIFKLMTGLDAKKIKKQIKVVSFPENPASQPLTIKLNLSTLMALKKYINYI